LCRDEADQVSNLVCTIKEDDRPYLVGLPERQNSEPFCWTPASGWLLRRTAIESVGPWRFYKDCYAIPSQDWLFRAWKAGKRLLINPELTVVAIYSGGRKLAYAKRESEINERYFRELQTPHRLRERILLDLSLRTAAEVRNPQITKIVSRFIKNFIIKTIFRSRGNPYAFLYFVLHRRKGGFVEKLRKNRGLKKIKVQGQ
jgi:hypothetical protein